MSYIRQAMPDQYRRVARMVGLCLFSGRSVDNWHGLSVVLTARLEPEERALLGWSVLRSLTPGQAVDVLNTVLPMRAGQPIAAFNDPADEAAFWTQVANPDELDAYAVAIFLAMSAVKQRAFLDFAGRAAA
ncbi:MAG: hypothetical protein AAGF20_12755 [Pseudomonadota bacterium]